MALYLSLIHILEEINTDGIIKILMKILHIIMLYSIIISEEGVDIMSMALMDCIEKLVPISDFSQGKAGKIFSDVAENNSEYIVLKNNQPTAVLVSVKEYKETQNKLAKLERLLEMVENFRLLKLAESRVCLLYTSNPSNIVLNPPFCLS